MRYFPHEKYLVILATDIQAVTFEYSIQKNRSLAKHYFSYTSISVKHEKGLAIKRIFSKNPGTETVNLLVSESIWNSAPPLFLPYSFVLI